MKIFANYGMKNNLGALFAATSLFVAAPLVSSAQTGSQLNQDTFESSITVSPKGTNKAAVLLTAPDPSVKINGENRIATIVVDLSKNILYKYNDQGEATAAYLVASGKKSSPTDTGVRVVTHIESYPYKTAPLITKRRKEPWNYGPKIICLNIIDPKTGRKSPTGEFIHGNNNPNSLGKYVSLGCIRMDNEVIKKLSKEVKPNDIVIITKS